MPDARELLPAVRNQHPFPQDPLHTEYHMKQAALREDHDATAGLPREVVATVVQWRGRIALFKRSQFVGHECGLWHCITGYLEPHVTPEQQALTELEEEAGLLPQDLADLQRGERLLIPDHLGNP